MSSLRAMLSVQELSLEKPLPCCTSAQLGPSQAVETWSMKLNRKSVAGSSDLYMRQCCTSLKPLNLRNHMNMITKIRLGNQLDFRLQLPCEQLLTPPLSLIWKLIE